MSASVSRVSPVDPIRLSRRIGLGAALASSLFGILYLIGLGVNLTTSGSVVPAGNDVKAAAAVIALLWNVVLLVLFVTLRREADPSRAILAEVALTSAVVVCALSCASWFVGLTALVHLDRIADPALAGLLDPYTPGSLAYALEHLGWGLFFGLATLLAGMAFSAQGVSPWLRWGFMATGILSLGHFLGVIAGQAGLIALGFISWGVVFPLSCVLLALFFRRRIANSSS